MTIIEIAMLKKLFGTGGGTHFQSTTTLMAAETKCEEKVN